MNNIQSKINSELRRPNAGKDAFCNVVADVAQEIADNAGGGGTSIPKLKVLRVEEVTIDSNTMKEVIFDDASNEILDNLVGEKIELGSGAGSVTSRAILMDAESISLLTNAPTEAQLTGSVIGFAMLSTEYSEEGYNSISNQIVLPFTTLTRYIELPEVPEEGLNRWFIG